MFIRVVLLFVALFVVQTVAFLPVAIGAEQEMTKPWQGRLGDGAVIDEAGLRRIIEEHAVWADTDEREGRRALLKGAVLRGANLNNANLWDADLTGADLCGADLAHAHLDANLRGANLSRANLSHAILYGADLRGANLLGANLEYSVFSKANLHGVLYEPSQRNRPPQISALATATGLWQMYYQDNPSPLVQLREYFRAGGFTGAARQVRHALKHNQGGVSWHSYLSFVLLGWPTGWGELPFKPLLLLAFTMAWFALIYLAGFMNPEPRGIVFKDPSSRSGRKPEFPWECLWGALYFSLQMSTHLFWKKISSGTWMTRMQPTETVITPQGWYRLVAGVQNVVSNYLVALFLLTYFGGLFKD